MAACQDNRQSFRLAAVCQNNAFTCFVFHDKIGDPRTKMNFSPRVENGLPDIGDNSRQLVGPDVRVGIN